MTSASLCIGFLLTALDQAQPLFPPRCKCVESLLVQLFVLGMLSDRV